MFQELGLGRLQMRLDALEQAAAPIIKHFS
jgi:hypothetical protein